MTGPDMWYAYGGGVRRCSPPSGRNKQLDVDPVFVACCVLLMNVLVGTRGFTWATTAVSILSDFDSFMLHVKPHPDAARLTKIECHECWLKQLGYMRDCGVFEDAKGERKAYGRFFVVEKPGLTLTGRPISDMSALSRLCARPYPVNVAHLPSFLRLIGVWRRASGFIWAADYRHWFLQNPLKDPRIRSFFIVRCADIILQATCTVMGFSWSSFCCNAITHAIVFGEFPESLRKYIDWSLLEGDTTPAWVILRDPATGQDIGAILCFYDNIYVISEHEWLVKKIKKHVIRRSAFCNAKFKCTFCESCKIHVKSKDIVHEDREDIQVKDRKDLCPVCRTILAPSPVGQSADFLGVTLRFENDKWVWSHRDAPHWTTDVPLTAPRRDFAHFVGVMVWDAAVNLESLERIDPAMRIIRRLTKGVSKRVQWAEHVSISTDEMTTLKKLMGQAINRGTMYVADPIHRNVITTPHRYVFVATDASKDLVSWVEVDVNLPSDVSGYARGLNYDWGPAVGLHIFVKELQSSSWGIQEMCARYKNVTIVIVTDNSAVYYVLRRGFSGVDIATPHLEMINIHLLENGNVILPVLLSGTLNIGDNPTRGHDLEHARLKATHHSMMAAVRGGSLKLASWSSKRPRSIIERMRIEEAPIEILEEQESFDNRDGE